MPQLNPEFFISQLFWLIITFTFLFIFLWRISLPRISTVLDKRSSKINEDIRAAKQHQAEAEEIQKKINIKLSEAKRETAELIKKSNSDFQNYSTKELEKIDVILNKKIDDASKTIENNRVNSINEVNSQIYDITKIAISKISKININDNEIKEMVSSIEERNVN
jgi:F-type H+-transporting ATPase subunit b